MATIALLADVHGNLPALEAVVADVAARGLSRVANLGDHASGPLWPRETIDFLMRQSWIQIAGNHDRNVAHEDPASHGPSDRFAFEQIGDAHKRWLASLPQTFADGDALLLCHGTPSDDALYLLETPDHGFLRLARADEVDARLGARPAPIIACGHSHIPRNILAPCGSRVVNPGSVGLQAYEDTGSDPHVSETGSPLARYAVLEYGAGRPSVAFIAVDYDYQAAARRAEANGRPDWAHALRTGYA